MALAVLALYPVNERRIIIGRAVGVYRHAIISFAGKSR